MTDKTAQTELHRIFLIEGLPDPLTPASAHLQLFDNYIENTRLRIRSIRDPQSKKWTRILEQKFAPVNDLSCRKLSQIYLNDAEYAALEHLEGREIRKNRYFHEFDGRSMIFDIHIGKLWGLCTMTAAFENADALTNFVPPPFCIFEVTQESAFFGSELVGKTFADVQEAVERLERITPIVSEMPDE